MQQVRKSKVLLEPASTLCMQEAKALTRPRVCAGSIDPSPLAGVAGAISAKNLVCWPFLTLIHSDGSEEAMQMRILV